MIYYVRICSRSVGSGIYVQVPPKVSFWILIQLRWIWYVRTDSSRKIFLHPKDLLLDDALVYLSRNPVCDKVPNLIRNLIESSLKEKIQDQSVSTYVLDSLSVLTLATGI
jgi:hypothetical protein